MRRAALRAALLWIHILLPSLAGAQVGSGTKTISGVVRDVVTQAPIEAVLVTVEGTGSTTLTDPQGRFVLRGVPPGEQVWIFRRLGYLEWRQEVELDDGESITVGLAPQPRVLEGIEVMVDRLEQRRRAAPVSVRSLDHPGIVASASNSLLDVARLRGMVYPTLCADGEGDLNCTWSRGRNVRVQVCIDERPALGGLQELAAFSPHEIHLIEAYGYGTALRVYTQQFASRLASGRERLRPILWQVGFCM